MLLPLEGVHQLLHVHVFNTCAFIHPANVYGAPVVQQERPRVTRSSMMNPTEGAGPGQGKQKRKYTQMQSCSDNPRKGARGSLSSQRDKEAKSH